MRIALGIEYKGTPFHGWQRQEGLETVQGCVECALSRVADSTVELVCAGRTDRGVHAEMQVVHFDTEAVRDLDAWVRGGNSYLPEEVVILWAKEVDTTFNARFSAKSRTYHYMIFNRPIRSALMADRAAWVQRPLDEKKMHDSAQCLLGEQDFSAFRAAGCQSNTPMRNLISISVEREGMHLVHVYITANAFLYHMVRNIVGTLIEVGLGQRTVESVHTLLASKDRTQAAKTAPAQGLYFVAPSYPEGLLLEGEIFL